MSNQAFIQVELKFCERCGGLWLRAKEAADIYCPQCAPEMQQVARPRKKPPVSEKSFVESGGAVCA